MSVISVICLFALIHVSCGLTCLNCPSIKHARFCRHVRHCSQGQVCGIERFLDEYGDTVFKLGCVDQRGCKSISHKRLLNGLPKPTQSGDCSHCCSAELCNTNGCGETDTFQQNTNVCYKCDGLVEGDLCNMISFCNDNEMCYIQEGSRHGEKFYESGCKSKYICASAHSPIVGRRQLNSAGPQLRCCQGRLCNQNYKTMLVPTSSPGNQYTPTSQNQSHFHNNCHKSITPPSSENIKGNSFLMIFPKTYLSESASPYALVASHGNGIVHKFSFSSHYNVSSLYSPTNYILPFNRNIYMEDGQLLRGSELTFTSDVSVYGFTYVNTTSERYSEGYLAIPNRFLSTKYIIPTYKPYSSGEYSNVIAMTSILPNTIINIHTKINGASSTYKSVVLRQFETYQISGGYDYSGTLITSTNPIAIISGIISHYYKSRRNPLLESVLPLKQWDKVYIIPDIATRPNKLVRLYSNHHTNFTIHYGDKIESKEITERNFIEIEHTQIAYLNASQDIMVMVLPVGLADDSGDHYMMTVHGINQYLSEYEFAVPNGFTNFVSITVQSNYVSGFILDGRPMNHENGSHIFGGLNHYSSFSAIVSSGVHKISHTSNVKFGLWVYGNGPKDGYGYPAGIAFRT